MIVLTVVLVLLAAVTGGHLLLTFALIRRVRELQRRIPRPGDGLPEVGTPVDRFAVDRLDGGRFDTGDLAGENLVGFFAAGCTPCSAVVADLLADPPAERFVAFVDNGDDEATTELVRTLSAIAEVIRLPFGSPVPAAFDQEGFPTLLRVHDGVITAAGRRPADLGQLAVR